MYYKPSPVELSINICAPPVSVISGDNARLIAHHGSLFTDRIIRMELKEGVSGGRIPDDGCEFLLL
jgi:hypothetical protein